MALFKSMKGGFLNELSQANQLALTTNLWSSRDANGYMVITVHFITNQWDLKKQIISFKELPPLHTGLGISKQLISTLMDWKALDKFAFCTLNNASSKNTAISGLSSVLQHLN